MSRNALCSVISISMKTALLIVYLYKLEMLSKNKYLYCWRMHYVISILRENV